MKNTIALKIASATLLFSAMLSSAQTYEVASNGKQFAFFKDTVAQIKSFTGKNSEGKTYLHWNVACQHSDGLYIIYSSLNDKDYDVVGYKRGIGVPISTPVAYYFEDEHPMEGTTYYQIVHLSMNKTYMISEKISVIFERTDSSNLE